MRQMHERMLSCHVSKFFPYTTCTYLGAQEVLFYFEPWAHV